MSDLNPWAVVVATVASFLFSGGWYALHGSRLARLSAAYAQDVRSPGATAMVELFRGLVVGIGVSTLVAWTGAEGVVALLGLAALLVVCFPVVLLWGSVWHEQVPPALALIHVCDWLVKLVLITLIVGLWR